MTSAIIQTLPSKFYTMKAIARYLAIVGVIGFIAAVVTGYVYQSEQQLDILVKSLAIAAVVSFVLGVIVHSIFNQKFKEKFLPYLFSQLKSGVSLERASDSRLTRQQRLLVEDFVQYSISFGDVMSGSVNGLNFVGIETEHYILTEDTEYDRNTVIETGEGHANRHEVIETGFSYFFNQDDLSDDQINLIETYYKNPHNNFQSVWSDDTDDEYYITVLAHNENTTAKFFEAPGLFSKIDLNNLKMKHDLDLFMTLPYALDEISN